MSKKAKTATLIALMMLVSTCAHTVWAEQTAITVSEDTYVINTEPNTNKGTAPTLRVYAEIHYTGNWTTNAWLKFNVSSIPANAIIKSAVLRMNVTTIATAGWVEIGVFACNDTSWNEHSLTWNNTPPLSKNETICTTSVSATNRTYDFNVTSIVKESSTFSLVLKVTNASDPMVGQVSFESKEGTFPPTLIVEYAFEPESFDYTPIIAIAVLVVSVPLAVGIFLFQKTRKGKTNTTN